MLLRRIKLNAVLLILMCSAAQAVDLTIVTPVAAECVPSQRAMATGVAGQEVDIVESDILLDLDVENADFFSATVSIAAHSCGDQPCQRAVDGNGAAAVDENGHPAYCARPSVASAIDRCRPGQLRLSVDAPGMHVAVVKFEDWDKVELQDKQVST